jgi:phage N-6-adenine-methyltransferase
MTKLDVMFSSDKMEWETPQDFFDNLNKEFNFELDVCATKENTKCKRYFTKEQNGLLESNKGNWSKCNWMNPPYGRDIRNWIRHAYKNAKMYGNTTVALLPARTDTRWFHDYIYNKMEIRFIKGRLKFSGSKNSAPFPSMIVIFK